MILIHVWLMDVSLGTAACYPEPKSPSSRFLCQITLLPIHLHSAAYFTKVKCAPGSVYCVHVSHPSGQPPCYHRPWASPSAADPCDLSPMWSLSHVPATFHVLSSTCGLSIRGWTFSFSSFLLKNCILYQAEYGRRHHPPSFHEWCQKTRSK